MGTPACFLPFIQRETIFVTIYYQGETFLKRTKIVVTDGFRFDYGTGQQKVLLINLFGPFW